MVQIPSSGLNVNKFLAQHGVPRLHQAGGPFRHFWICFSRPAFKKTFGANHDYGPELNILAEKSVQTNRTKLFPDQVSGDDWGALNRPPKVPQEAQREPAV